MLVLTRKTNQSIMYRREVYLSITGEDGDDVGPETRERVEAALGTLAKGD